MKRPTTAPQPQPTRRERRAEARSTRRPPGDRERQLAWRWWTEWRWILPALVAAVFVYANAMRGEFVYDDNRQIARNALIQDNAHIGTALASDVWAFKGGGTLAASNYWRPTFVSWLIVNFRLFGQQPAGWHLTNLLLHLLVVVLGYCLARGLRVDKPIAAAIALVFAVHPAHVESVSWISGSPDLLLAPALLGSLLIVPSLGGSARWQQWAAALGLYVVALGAKEVAIIFPAIVFVRMWRRSDDEPANLRAAARIAAIFAGVAALYFVVRLTVLGSFSRPVDRAPDLVSALLSVPEALLFYLQHLVWPWPIGPSYPLRPIAAGTIGLTTFVIPLAVVAAAAAAVWWLARRSLAGRTGAALLVLPLLPALNISAFPPDQMVHDRYLYLPLLGFLVVLLAGLADVVRQRLPQFDAARAVAMAAIVWAVALGTLTVRYNRAWQNDVALWALAVHVDPTSGGNFAQYAAALEAAHRIDDMAVAADKAVALEPTTSALVIRARARVARKDFEGALADTRAVQARPPEQLEVYGLYQSYEAAAIAYERQGKLNEAANLLAQARERLPIYRAALTSRLAVILYEGGDRQRALSELEAVRGIARTELLPESNEVLLRIGMLQAEFNRPAEARRALQEYLAATATVAGETIRADRAEATALLAKLPR